MSIGVRTRLPEAHGISVTPGIRILTMSSAIDSSWALGGVKATMAQISLRPNVRKFWPWVIGAFLIGAIVMAFMPPLPPSSLSLLAFGFLPNEVSRLFQVAKS